VNDDGTSSGVATFEPNGSKENPFVLPIFDDPEKIIAPSEFNYTEKPLGESFFPAAQVTYSKVRVKNLDKSIAAEGGNPGNTLSKHATGEVVTEFYTSKDFPTISDYTEVQAEFDRTGPLGNFLKVRTRSHLAMSQGIVVHANDMNGKMKSQRVLAEGQTDGQFISGVDYIYAQDSTGKLDNDVFTVDSAGKLTKQKMGVEVEMITDFRKSKAKSQNLGADGNLAVIATIFFGAPAFIPTILPNCKSSA